jgi:hypothetical protein
MAGCGEIAAFLAELVVEADTLFGAPDEQNAIAITNALSAAAPEVAVTAADAHMREYALWAPNDVVARDRPDHRGWALGIMTDRLTKQDPRTQYPRPPFPEQPQTAPGIASEMDPKPDHGETSYRARENLPAAGLSSPAATVVSDVRPPSPSRARGPTSPSPICRTRKRMRRRW